MRLLFLVFALLAAGLPGPPALAVLPDEVLDNPLLEKRAREISKGLRCLVCQNQSIDDSDAGLARDLRVLVRERLVAGDSDDEVVQFVVKRYGDFVLLKPPFKGATLVLWIGPAVIVALGLVWLIVFFRRRRSSAAATAPKTLSADEERRIAELLDDDEP